MKVIITAILAAAGMCAQEPSTTISQAPPIRGYQVLNFYSGTNLIFQCITPSAQQKPGSALNPPVTVTTISNANPGAVTATAHGFDFESVATTNPTITIAGATGGWVGINGTWRATITSANAFTIPVDTSAFGVFTGQSITVTTMAPRITLAIWSIHGFIYDAGNNLLFSGWASNPGGAGKGITSGSTGMDKICSNRTSLSYQ